MICLDRATVTSFFFLLVYRHRPSKSPLDRPIQVPVSKPCGLLVIDKKDTTKSTHCLRDPAFIRLTRDTEYSVD